jgi:hypothetical protein
MVTKSYKFFKKMNTWVWGDMLSSLGTDMDLYDTKTALPGKIEYKIIKS